MVDVTSFLRHAETYLSAQISTTTLNQANSLARKTSDIATILDRIISRDTLAGRYLYSGIADRLHRERDAITRALTAELITLLKDISERGLPPEEALGGLRKVLRLPNMERDVLIANAAARLSSEATSEIYEATPEGSELEFAQALITLVNDEYFPDTTEQSDNL
ncbi:hypothetical protein ACWEQG_38540 [Microbispora sp. NPDC004025]